MHYRISTWVDDECVGMTTRKRRDAANLAYLRAVHAMCEANGLLDRPIAHRLTHEARRAGSDLRWDHGSTLLNYCVTFSTQRD